MTAVVHISGSSWDCPAVAEGDRVGSLIGPATCEHCITDAAWNIARINQITVDAALDRIAAHQARYRWYGPEPTQVPRCADE